MPIYAKLIPDWRAPPTHNNVNSALSFSLSRLNKDHDVAPFNSAPLFLVLHVARWPYMLQAGHFVDIIRIYYIIDHLYMFTGRLCELCGWREHIRLDPQDSGRNIDSKMYYLLQVHFVWWYWSNCCSTSTWFDFLLMVIIPEKALFCLVLACCIITLVLLLIARTNFSEFSDDWHNR